MSNLFVDSCHSINLKRVCVYVGGWVLVFLFVLCAWEGALRFRNQAIFQLTSNFFSLYFMCAEFTKVVLLLYLDFLDDEWQRYDHETLNSNSGGLRQRGLSGEPARGRVPFNIWRSKAIEVGG